MGDLLDQQEGPATVIRSHGGPLRGRQPGRDKLLQHSRFALAARDPTESRSPVPESFSARDGVLSLQVERMRESGEHHPQHVPVRMAADHLAGKFQEAGRGVDPERREASSKCRVDSDPPARRH